MNPHEERTAAALFRALVRLRTAEDRELRLSPGQRAARDLYRRDPTASLAAVARRMGCSRERVRQHLNAVARKRGRLAVRLAWFVRQRTQDPP